MFDGVTLNQLRTFVAVSDEAGFSGAARRLRRAQSAVSHAIAALEQALAVELFERHVRKAMLTAAERSILPDARAVIAQTEEMKTRPRSVAKLGAPHLSVAVDVYFPREKLARLPSRPAKRSPDSDNRLANDDHARWRGLATGKCRVACGDRGRHPRAEAQRDRTALSIRDTDGYRLRAIPRAR
jgi:DNA-binding transcriptional LysR family regulator